MPSLALASLWNRRISALLTILAVAVSVFLYLGVGKLKSAAETSFNQTIHGTDLIVGARTSPVSLVLFSVFHIGNPSAAITWESFQWLEEREDVDWAVPIALGDSHKGYRVIGTTGDFFDRYQFRGGQEVSFASGVAFDDLYDVVLGAKVAADLGYEIGSEITLSHGLGEVSFMEHDNRPFTVTGILASTGTPVDKSVLVSLQAIEAIHVGWQSGAPSPIARMVTADDVRKMDLTPDALAAVLVGLSERRTLLRTQNSINTYREEALVAAIPSQAISEVWELVGIAGNALLIVSAFVIVVGLVSILTSILSSLRERRREMAVLRAVGAGPGHIMGLLISEAIFLAAIGAAIGITLVYLASFIAGPIFENRFGIQITVSAPGATDAYVFLTVCGLAGILALFPAIGAMRSSLADGLSIKL
ncbi:MAG: peptide ABC transporter permease [Ponticaulis sp.]|nr:peptide ABC transporter permease [Ponticaulis sp.]